MKRYLFFATSNSDFELITPQFVLCGNPRTVTLNPISSASSFLWEQIQPDPLILPVTFSPNNTSKNIVVSIPNGVTTKVVLRVTLNGNTSNYIYIEINTLLEDKTTLFSKGVISNIINDNTLYSNIPYIFVPIVSDGPQAIYYTNNTQQTGIRFLSSYYRNAYTNSITINNLQTVLINPETRVKLNINTSYSLLKNWLNLSVISQTVEPQNQSIDLNSTVIADEIILSNTFNKGNAINIVQTRTPFTVYNYNLLETITGSFNKGSSINISQTRTPFTVITYNLLETITSSFNKGNSINISQTRTPYTSNIVG